MLAFVDSGKSTLRFIGHHLRPNLTVNTTATHGCHAYFFMEYVAYDCIACNREAT
jgi:hypothetical protein